METIDELPAAFPGKEFSLRWGDDRFSEYINEINYFDVGRTTEGAEVVIPDIWYRSLAFLDRDFWHAKYMDGGAGKIGEYVLNPGQADALSKAAVIEQKRKAEDPTLETFNPLRQLKIGKDGLLYVGAGGWDFEPYAAVKKIDVLGEADFSTAVLGYYGFFRFSDSDVPNFVPPELADEANTFGFIDEPRVVVGPNGEHDFQIARIRFYKVLADLDYPTDGFAPPEPVIETEEDSDFPSAYVTEIGGQTVLVDPEGAAMARVVSKHNCRGLLELNTERVGHFKHRVSELGKTPREVVITLINVDDPKGSVLADILMPGTDWQEYRDRGELPVARGLAAREGIEEFLGVVDKEAADKLRQTNSLAVVVVDHGVAETFEA